MKTGAGTLSLTATNLYTGVTDVHEGLLLVDGAVINSPGRMDIGLNAATPAHYQQNSGSVTVGTQFVIGAHGSTGAATIFDGTLRVNGTLHAGGYGEGAGTGFLEVNGGTVTATTSLNFGGGGPNNGVVNLNGGTLEVPLINQSGSGSSLFRFNGGVLRATASGTLMQGLTQASVRAGGARFDTAGIDSVVAQPLLHDAGLAPDTPDGGLIKFGAGQLSITGANAYNGPTAVSNGTLRITSPFLHVDSAVRVGAGAVLFLDFSGTNTVATLDVGGTAMPAGLYGSTASGVASPDDTHFGGAGVLRVLNGPTATPYQLWAAANGLDGTPGHENGAGDDPDGDGAPNLSEFAVGSDPLDDASRGLFEVRAEDTLADVDALDELTLTLPARAGASFTADGAGLTAVVDGVRYRVDGSLDLAGFASAVEEVTPALGNTIPPSGYTLHTFRLVASNGANGPGYLRLRVTDP
jgi:autotransporter-associated beta strand protein